MRAYYFEFKKLKMDGESESLSTSGSITTQYRIVECLAVLYDEYSTVFFAMILPRKILYIYIYIYIFTRDGTIY